VEVVSLVHSHWHPQAKELLHARLYFFFDFKNEKANHNIPYNFTNT
jgi:hypothetical protein